MKKLLRHKWIRQNGFRIDKCEYCGTVRYWDSGYQRIMYKWKGMLGYTPPPCKRVYFSDADMN